MSERKKCTFGEKLFSLKRKKRKKEKSLYCFYVFFIQTIRKITGIRYRYIYTYITTQEIQTHPILYAKQYHD